MSEKSENVEKNSEKSSEHETETSETEKRSKSLSVILTTGDVSFTVARSLLTKNSQYFQAMLDGNFKEANQKQIFIHNITADAMECILNFFNFNSIEFQSLDTVNDLFHAANYFGLDQFRQKIEKKLIHFIKNDTCFKIFNICKEHSLSVLEPIIKSYILYSFDEVRDYICEIKNIEILHWYLSHHNLNTDDEMDVFNTGCKWLMKNSDDDNDILIILSCLIYHKLNVESLNIMLSIEYIKNNALAKSIIKGIIHIDETYSIKTFFEPENENSLRNYFEKDIYDIIYGFLSCKNHRNPLMKPCILKRSNESTDIMTYDSDEKKLVQYLPLPGYPWWGSNIVSWKGFNLLMLFGKMKNNDTWNYDLKNYNCLTKTWEILPSKIPSPRRHATAIVNGDLLYVIGGFGQFRVILNSVQMYNIKTQTWTSLPDLPEYSTFLVACFHKGRLYVSGEYFYVLENDFWINLGALKTRYSAILSHQNYLLFARKWIKQLYFRENNEIEDEIKNNRVVKKCHYNVSGMLKIGNVVYIFSEGDSIDNSIAVEMFMLNEKLEEDLNSATDLLWLDNETDGAYHTSSGCFTLADLNIADNFINRYGERWFK